MGRTRQKIVSEEELEQKQVEAAGAEVKPVENKTPGPEIKTRKKTYLPVGVVHIRVNPNNTIASLTDSQGNLLCWSSAGVAGFKNTKKATPYAGSRVVSMLLDKMKSYEIGEVRVIVRGVGASRESALRTLFTADLNFQLIEDRTPFAFGGVKAPKPRRV